MQSREDLEGGAPRVTEPSSKVCSGAPERAPEDARSISFRKWSRRLLLVLASLALTLLGLEAALRTFGAVEGRGFFSEHRNLLIQPAKMTRPFRNFGMSFTEKKGDQVFIRSRHGELYPLEKRPGTIRIVCLGGSTTEDLPSFKAAGVHYPLLLERWLKRELGRQDVEVINVGYSAYSTPHLIIALALDVVDWSPDLLLLSENFNDLSATWWPGFVADYSHKYAHSSYQPDNARRFTTVNALFQHSQLYWWLKDQLSLVRERAPLRRESKGPEPLAEGLRVFERNLRTFAAIARSHGVPVVFGTQPLQPGEDLFRRHIEAKAYNDVVVYPLHEEFLTQHRRYNQALLQVGRDLEIPAADNDRVLGGRRDLFVDFIHYSLEGSKTMAEAWGRFLVETHLVGPGVASKKGEP